MTNPDYADDLAFLANIPAQAEFLLYSQVQAVVGIFLFINTNKVEYIFFKQKKAISTQSSNPLKSVEQFISLCNNILSTESDVNICLAKAWNSL